MRPIHVSAGINYEGAEKLDPEWHQMRARKVIKFVPFLLHRYALIVTRLVLVLFTVRPN